MSTDRLLEFVWSLVQVQPAALVYLGVIVLGYVLKLSPRVDNQVIPHWTIPSAAVVYLALCIPPQAVAADLLSVIRYVVTTLILGGAVGLSAWATHAFWLKRIEDSLPVLGPALKNLQVTNPATAAPPEAGDNQPTKDH